MSDSDTPQASQPIRARSVQKIGQELAVAWEDGSESYFSLADLRRHCPCATCGGEPDVMGNVVRPVNEYSAGSFELMAFEPVGGYAVQLTWGDGHRTGLYSWQYLRRLEAALPKP
jgi:DUF971 family protein